MRLNVLSSAPIFNRSFISRNSFGIMIVLVCRIGFLSLSSPLESVQDSWIGDLDTHLASQLTFDFSVTTELL